MPELRKTTLRFTETVRAVIEEEAALDGSSVAQFIREAALARAMYQRGRRGLPLEDQALELAERIYRELRERLAAEDGDPWEGPERRRARGRRQSD